MYQCVVVICTKACAGPVTPYTAPENGKFRHVAYTGVFNVVDYSAISFPCGVVADKEKDQMTPGYKPLSDECKAIQDECKLTVCTAPSITLT